MGVEDKKHAPAGVFILLFNEFAIAHQLFMAPHPNPPHKGEGITVVGICVFQQPVKDRQNQTDCGREDGWRGHLQGHGSSCPCAPAFVSPNPPASTS